jgi:hypothetical protein
VHREMFKFKFWPVGTVVFIEDCSAAGEWGHLTAHREPDEVVIGRDCPTPQGLVFYSI